MDWGWSFVGIGWQKWFTQYSRVLSPLIPTKTLDRDQVTCNRHVTDEQCCDMRSCSDRLIYSARYSTSATGSSTVHHYSAWSCLLIFDPTAESACYGTVHRWHAYGMTVVEVKPAEWLVDIIKLHVYKSCNHQLACTGKSFIFDLRFIPFWAIIYLLLLICPSTALLKVPW